MVTKQIKDNRNNIIYEEHDSGYKEENKYDDNNNLISSTQTYPNGIVETEKYNY